MVILSDLMEIRLRSKKVIFKEMAHEFKYLVISQQFTL